MTMPSVAARAYFRKKLNSLLEIADDEGFIQLIWAANALQSDGELAAAPYLDHQYPRSAVTTDMTAQSFIYKWELETLVNELLVVPKRAEPKRGRHRSLRIDRYENAVLAANALRRLENAEASRGLNNVTVFREMARIANRQFDWQRGYFNVPQFYRNAFVYGQGACAAYFERQHGITINQLSLVGFGIHTWLVGQPIFGRKMDMSAMGISADDLDRALALVSSPFSKMQALAKAERAGIYHTAYRPSVLRRYPCISFGESNERIRSPLPQLVLERVTGGVFYDVIGGGGEVRRDYGARFEEYSLNYLRAVLAGLTWCEEQQYLVKRNRINTPDIFLVQDGELSLAIECKATRMGYGAKFGGGEVDERGFEDIIKAVVQLWRFFSHCRRGFSGHSVKADAVGAVLTLDNWLVMANPLQAEVIMAAKAIVAAKDPQILPEDQRPISFFSVTDMESTLVTATEASFLAAVRASADPKYHGWMLTSVHDKFKEPGQVSRPYPFRGDMGRVLPWWTQIEEEKERRAKAVL